MTQSHTSRRPAGSDRDSAERAIELRLAHLRVRTGAYAHARAELETMVGWGLLEGESLLDLAEVRWRTGDLGGAGHAAEAYLATGGEDPLALVIAAEAMAALGRPTEARRLAGRAIAGGNLPIDEMFAGMPRSSIWPRDPAAPGEPIGALFPAPGGPGSGDESGRTAGRSGGRPGPMVAEPAASAPSQARSGAQSLALESPTSAPAAYEGPGLWDTHVHEGGTFGAPASPDPQAELASAQEALAAGDLGSGAVRLAVALRLSPVLAPAILDVASRYDGPSFDLIRGDAYRLVGHEAEARRAYAAAASGLTAAGTDGNRGGSEGHSDLAAGSDPAGATDAAGATDPAGVSDSGADRPDTQLLSEEKS